MFPNVKPSFGQTNPTTTFGTGFSGATQFGQSTFGKSPQTGFTTSAFGAPAATAGASTAPQSTGLFGNASTGGTGTLFGAVATSAPGSVFGQNQNTATAGFGFGAAANPGASGNGAGTLFGTTAGTPNTAVTGTSLFGQSKPTFGFGSGTTPGQTATGGLFGQTAQPSVQPGTSSLFGQQATGTTSTGLFGASTGAGGFGTASGTTVKFQPVTGTDTMMKNGQSTTIATRHHCITCMKEYDGKSLEELRSEDYQAQRKGQGATSGGLFGPTGQTSLFSQPNVSSANTPFGDKTIFGAPAPIGFGAGTSVFGATQATAGTAAPTASTGLFGKPNTGFAAPTTSTGFFNSNTQTNQIAFGATAAAKPFGTQTSLFGQPQQTANTFPQTTGFGTFGTQNQNIGLFGQNKTPAFSMGNNAGGFGQPALPNPAQATTATTGGFFGQNKPATTTSFGVTPFGATNTAPGTQPNLFGQQNANTSLFGQNTFKPQQPNFFGQNTTNTLGMSLNTGTNTLFNSGGLKPIGTQPGTGTGMFGTNTSSGGSLFSGGFGSLPGGTGLGQTGLNANTGGLNFMSSGTVGLNNNTNLMGTAQQQPPSSVMQQFISLAALPYGDTPIFRNLIPASGKTEELLKPPPAAQKNLGGLAAPYKVSSPGTNSPGHNKLRVKALFGSNTTKKSLFDGLEEDEPSLGTISSPATKSNVQQSPQSTVLFLPRNSCKRLVLKPKSQPVNGHLSSISENGTNGSSVKNGAKIHQGEDKTTASPAINGHTASPKTPNDWLRKPARPLLNSDENSATNETQMENTVDNWAQQSPKSPNLPSNMQSPQSNDCCKSTITEDLENSFARDKADESSLCLGEDNEDTNPELIDRPAHPAGIMLRRSGYYTIPTLDTLARIVGQDGSCVPDNFTIGREGYGNIFFPEPFNIQNLNLDELVHIRHKEVIVYPDDDDKPPLGQGLNRPAQVTLDRVWPINKGTRLPVTDVEQIDQLGFETRLQRVCGRAGTHFIEYRPQTGSWVFKVDHFSKYGLEDSDSDDELKAAEAKKLKTTLPSSTIIAASVTNTITTISPSNQNKHLYPVEELEIAKAGLGGLGGLGGVLTPYDPAHFSPQVRMEEDDQKSRDYSIDTSPTANLAQASGISSQKLQLMKASFFIDQDEDEGLGGFDDEELDDEDEISPSPSQTPFKEIEEIPMFRSKIRSRPSEFFPEKSLSKTTIQPPKAQERPRTVRLLRGIKFGFPLPNRSLAKCLADTGLMLHQRFRVGWAKDGILTTLLNNKQQQVQLMQMISSVDHRDSTDFEESIVGHLRIRLHHSITGTEIVIGNHANEEQVPGLASKSGFDALHEHCNHSQRLNILAENESGLLSYTSQIWDLCVALWGNLPQLDLCNTVHDTNMLRRQTVSDWLVSVSLASSKRDAAHATGANDLPEAIYSLLSGNQLLDACHLAQNHGEHACALIAAQAGASEAPKHMILSQLMHWINIKTECLVDPKRRKLMALAAGQLQLPGGTNVLEDLDWKRALGLHFWYLSSPVTSISEVLKLFDQTVSRKETGKPIAPKWDLEGSIEQQEDSCDLAYHLLKLFSDNGYSLERLLNPSTHTSDPLDYRLSWLLLEILQALGFSHLSTLAEAQIHTAFASQLEAQGLWHWAIFVLLYLREPGCRRDAIRQMLDRHVELGEDPDYLEREQFLFDELNLPSHWIYIAKATLAESLGQWDTAVRLLIKGSQWQQSHRLIIQHLAADALINEKHQYLKDLLEPLAKPERSGLIAGWLNAGNLILDYIHVVEELQKANSPASPEDLSYLLERLQPLLGNLCQRISLLPITSAKDRLMQSEMAKRTAHLVRQTVLLQGPSQGSSSAASSRVLARLISMLPMPEDYSRQELDQVVSCCVDELAFNTSIPTPIL